MILVSKPTGLRRLPISLLGLKTGTLLSRTPTLTPLLGFRPMRPADRQFAALHQLRDDCHSSMDFPTFFMSWWNVLILIVPLLVDPNQIHGETNCHNVKFLPRRSLTRAVQQWSAMSRSSEHIDNPLNGFVGAVVGGFEATVWRVVGIWAVVEAAVGDRPAEPFMEE